MGMLNERNQVNNEWKLIKDSDKYEVSMSGSIRNRRTGHFLKLAIDRYGYPKFSWKGLSGKTHYATVHRLVAIAWIPRKEGRNQVNHISGVKQDNRTVNLEWVDRSENIKHSYDMKLNKNAVEVIRRDLIDGSKVTFRSIKDAARALSTYASVLAPLMRYSSNNPFNGRYVFEIVNEDEVGRTSNSRNFGRPVFVYDKVTKTVMKYSSVLAGSYFTGVRSLSLLTPNKTIKAAGYVASFKKEDLPEYDDSCPELISKVRKSYLETPYQSAKLLYYVYDYYTKEEKEFPSLDSFVEYLTQVEPLNRVVNSRVVSMSLCQCSKAGKTALFKGLGIRSSLYNIPWFPYTEEVIRSSWFNLPAPTSMYKLEIGNDVKFIHGMQNLCEFLNYRTDKPYKRITLEEVQKACKIPNLRLTRCNKPIV